MSNFLLNVLKGGSNEISRLTDNDESLKITASIGSISSVIAIVLIIFFHKKCDNNLKKFTVMILFYISLYIIVISLGIGFLNLPLKTERDTNLFVDNLTLLFRVILIPICIIIALILLKIPRDKGEKYFEYMITHLLQSEDKENNLKKFGLLVIPVVYGLVEVATNGGNFTSLSTYYSLIAGIIGIIIVGGMKGLGLLMDSIPDQNITTNLEKIPSNMVAEVIVIFTTIITILTNMTQRVEGLIFSSIMLLLMLLGIKLIYKIKTDYLIIIGMVLIGLVIIVQIFLKFTIFKQENTLNINTLPNLEGELTKKQEEIVDLKAKLNDTKETSPTIIKMETTINANEKYPVDDINTIYNNYKNLTDKSKEYMEKLVEIIKEVKLNQSLAKDDREKKIYDDKLTNYNNLLDNHQIEERAILQQFIDNINKMDTLMKSYNDYIDDKQDVKDAKKAKDTAQEEYDKILKDVSATIGDMDESKRKLDSATDTYNNNDSVKGKYNANIKEEDILTSKQNRLSDLDDIYTKLNTDKNEKDSGILDSQKVNIDLMLYCVSIGGFILGIKSIKSIN